MKRRITVPEGHIALILPNQLADELRALLRDVRRESAKVNIRYRLKHPELDEVDDVDHRESVCGDVILHLLDAKEA